MKYNVLLLLVLFCTQLGYTQLQEEELKNNRLLNWYNLDWKKDRRLGIGTERAYLKFLKDMQVKKTVVVAVMDSGVDIDHKDFEGKIWINEDEIDGNGIDDDNNGYIDDIHGWNFLGNSMGGNIEHENLEYVRILKNYQDLEKEGKLKDIVEGSEEDILLKEITTLYEQESTLHKQNLLNIAEIRQSVQAAKAFIRQKTGAEVNTLNDVLLFDIKGDLTLKPALEYLLLSYSQGYSEDELNEIEDYTGKYVDFLLNLDLNARGKIGDDPFDITDVKYGNPDVIGPGASHGTGCAGVIGALRSNDGIGGAVKIMSIRTVPDGDERDKDVALGIRYAVNNGADIINMSFGKDYSPQKAFVDEAVKYAEEKGVLIVHSSGNSAKNLDVHNSFPTAYYSDGLKANNWLTVGASDDQLGKNLLAPFSNYGDTKVDLLAPGVDLLSLDLNNGYSVNSGTSLSAPVVSGVAALILSYYPELTAEELKDLLITSSKTKKPKKVYVPGEGGKKKLVDLLDEGGVVNVYKAFELLNERAN